MNTILETNRFRNLESQALPLLADAVGALACRRDRTPRLITEHPSRPTRPPANGRRAPVAGPNRRHTAQRGQDGGSARPRAPRRRSVGCQAVSHHVVPAPSEWRFCSRTRSSAGPPRAGCATTCADRPRGRPSTEQARRSRALASQEHRGCGLASCAGAHRSCPTDWTSTLDAPDRVLKNGGRKPKPLACKRLQGAAGRGVCNQTDDDPIWLTERAPRLGRRGRQDAAATHGNPRRMVPGEMSHRDAMAANWASRGSRRGARVQIRIRLSQPPVTKALPSRVKANPCTFSA